MIYEIKIILNLEATETISDAITYAKSKITKDKYVDLTILNKGKHFKIYNETAFANYTYVDGSTTHTGVLDLDTLYVHNIKGKADTVSINSANGRAEVPINFVDGMNSYEVIATVEDSLKAEVRVDKGTTSFGLILFDSQGFVELNQPLNCTAEAIDVHYLIIFKKI